MANLFTKLLILCFLIGLLCSCKSQINNDNEFTNNLSEEKEENGFLYSVSPVKNVILMNETAVFTVVITNYADDDYFLIEINKSNFIFEPLSVFVAKNSKTMFVVHIKPNSSAEDCKTHFLPLSIKSEKSNFNIVNREKIAIFINDNCVT